MFLDAILLVGLLSSTQSEGDGGFLYSAEVRMSVERVAAVLFPNAPVEWGVQARVSLADGEVMALQLVDEVTWQDSSGGLRISLVTGSPVSSPDPTCGWIVVTPDVVGDSVSPWATRLDPLAASVRLLRLEAVTPARMRIRSRAEYSEANKELVVHWEVDLDLKDKAIVRRIPLALQLPDDVRPRRIEAVVDDVGMQLKVGGHSILCAEPCVLDWPTLLEALRQEPAP